MKRHNTSAQTPGPCRDNPAIPPWAKALLGATLVGLLTATAWSQATNNFTDGEGASTFDQYPGTAENGWAEGWNYQFGINSGFSGYLAKIRT